MRPVRQDPEETMRDLDELMAAYRECDAEAEGQLLERMEGLLRGTVRKLMGRGIRFDRESMDVCQSVLLAFHLQARDGKIDFENEAALAGFLRTMVRHKMANLSDHMRALKRGGGAKGVDIDGDGFQLPALDPSASMVAGTAEIRKKIEATLGPEERAILEGRLAGRTNKEIGEKLGKSADAVRMIWNRAREKLADSGYRPGSG